MNKFKLLDDGLIVNKISKSYGNKKVVRDISISITEVKLLACLAQMAQEKLQHFI